MNAAILCNSTSSQGSSRPELIALLREKGYKVFLGGIDDGSLSPFFGPDTAEFMPIEASRGGTDPMGELRSIASVKKQVEKNRITAAVVYGVKNHAAMTIGAWKGGCKRIVCVVNGSGNLFRVNGIKGALLRAAAFPMLRSAYRKCAAVCFQNEDDRQLFIKKKLVKDTDKLFCTNGSGVNTERFPQRMLPCENRFLFLSRITATKGVFEYIEAARIVKKVCPTAVFDIVGPIDAGIESMKTSAIDEAAEEGIVNYHGPTKDVGAWLAKCRFFVYPSYYPEGVPRCVLQALSSGRPVLTCDTPGCRKTVDEGVNGFKVPARDPEALAEKMLWLINNPAEAERMAEESRRIAEDRFDVDDVNRQLTARLIGAGRRHE